MYIKRIKLTNFRNYKDLELNFDKHTNILYGANAQGKTNLVEAVYLCAVGRSPRTTKDREMINASADFAHITVETVKREGDIKIDIIISRTLKKTIKINGVPILKMGELMGNINCVFFAPDELKLIKESPQDRRRFMDIDISQMSKSYFYLLQRYEQVLAQRNKLIKNTRDYNVLKDTLPIYDVQLADTGSKIVISRIKFIEKLKKNADETNRYLTDDKENLELEYTGIVGNSIQEIKAILLKEYEKNYEKDFALGYTSIGPHRDDIKILVKGIDVRSFGSQGQQRTAALSLKLAELEIFKTEIGEAPVLLLDDVLSELDSERQKKLLQRIKNIQTILTCTHFDFADKNEQKQFKVQDGHIKNS
ncbi:MAG: DNA replication/repair protein RecF [Clostridia bacterium]|jgi:DNA replication and repair protein RecF|nr:DNA replication/repair protein RecF [Clostridia bacterium]MDD4276227.1 DNA replication/repair protein RecF [Clostridia bacterium]